MVLADFFSSRQARRLNDSGELRTLLLLLEPEPSLLFEITFYASFAKRTFELMQREGKDADGFPRMQQSFADAVEKVRSILRKLEMSGCTEASKYTLLTEDGFRNLMELIGDLSVVKNWMLQMGDEGQDFQQITETGSDT